MNTATRHSGMPQATSRSHNWANTCCGCGADRAPSVSHSTVALMSASCIGTELIVSASREMGVARRKIRDEEIVERCVFALVNEGAKILEEGIAQRASDIDVVYLTGYGFPPWRGGPMHYADSLGLYNVVRSMRRLAKNPHGDPAAWEPAPLLAKLAAEGKSFGGGAP